MDFATLWNPDRILDSQQSQSTNTGPVIYWMSRDQRVDDNWALLFAQSKAFDTAQPLYVFFSLTPNFPGANLRHYDFMLKGLREVEYQLGQLNIPFLLRLGEAQQNVSSIISTLKPSHLITDYSPLKISRKWKKEILAELPPEVSYYEVDAHNVIPPWITSSKQEFAARTIRPKIHKLLDNWLVEFPELLQMDEIDTQPNDWSEIEAAIAQVDTSVSPVTWLKPGAIAANQQLTHFIADLLKDYADLRNKPELNHLSHLSPYLHFGQISAQRILLEILKLPATDSRDTFVEELLVRRELSENYCHYSPNYDNPDGFPAWAQKTLATHQSDPREYIYSRQVLENSKTHDELWNASQSEMVRTGKMHGYMRMYWCKKILEWSPTPAIAQQNAIYLNDKYELDGRDPNGYTGIAWSIGGVHDRPWGEREIFGNIRYMSLASTGKKFDSKKYIRQQLQETLL